LPVQDPILIFAILLLGILAAPLLADRLRIPDLILLIAFGAVLGPSGAGVLELNPAISLFGAVGMLYIMFLAGLEIDLHQFMQTRRRGILFGLLTFAIPQGVGTLAGHYVLGLNWPASLLLASMFASHTLLAYPIASRLGINKTEPVAVTVGATIITDTLALLVLAVIADMARGIDLGPLFWLALAAGLSALVAVTLFGIPYLSRWFFQCVTENGSAQFLFVIVTVCACAYLSHYARMEPIIGAFLAGAAFNRLIPERSPLMNRVTFVGNTLFIPLFLISVGMLVNLRTLAGNPRNWFVGAVMVLCVISCKYAAAMIARRRFGYSVEAGKVIFGLSVVQAAATLAVVLVGYELGIFDDTILNGAIATIIVSCPLGSWIVDRYGRKIAQLEAVRPPARTEQRMLVLISRPEVVEPLLDLAFAMRNNAVPGGIYPLTVVRERDDLEVAVVQAENLLARCMTHAAGANMQTNPSLRVAMNVSDGVLHAAAEVRSNLVVAEWKSEQKMSVRFFGGFMDEMVKHCTSRLVFCKIVHPLNTIQRLLAIFPPAAERRLDLRGSIELSKRLAHQLGAELWVYLTGEGAGDLQHQIETARPACRLKIVQSAVWSRTRTRLFEDIRPHDMALLLVERSGGTLWTPTLDRLPDLMASRFGHLNLMVAYPPLPTGDQVLQESEEAESFFPVCLDYEMDSSVSLQENMSRMVRQALSHSAAAREEAVSLLMSSARSFPAELIPGVVLVHAHCGSTEESVLLIGYGQADWPFASLSFPPRIVLALLSPGTQPPEAHLKTLAAIARSFYDKSAAERIEQANSAREICLILKEKRRV
jgi:Kef-type K+ transport system membrane component KefB/mannitol/fructose-specific phosphotransferase system IIA component (Ntr-type)